MSLFESNFMRRLHCLPEDKKTLLLDTLENNRQETNKLFFIYPDSDYREKVHIEESFDKLQKKSVTTMWLLLGQEQYKSVKEIKGRLLEMERLISYHRFADMYAAACAEIINEHGYKKFRLCGKGIPNDEKIKYESYIQDYRNISDIDRENFITEVRQPFGKRITCMPAQTGHQRD